MRISARRLLLSLALPAALALPAPALACDDTAAAKVPTSASDLAAAESVTLCLVNERRSAAGLRPLVAERRLASAARGFASDMVDQAFFAHESPDGDSLTDRLRAARWVPSAGSWSAGENIAWGGGDLGSPKQIVAAWMASSGHRANILTAGFRELGVGIALGSPRGDQGYTAATYVTDFGSKVTAKRAQRARKASKRARRARR